eukprot:213420-Pelagomonas_calceolata.AAC.1
MAKLVSKERCAAHRLRAFLGLAVPITLVSTCWVATPTAAAAAAAAASALVAAATCRKRGAGPAKEPTATAFVAAATCAYVNEWTCAIQWNAQNACIATIAAAAAAAAPASSTRKFLCKDIGKESPWSSGADVVALPYVNLSISENGCPQTATPTSGKCSGCLRASAKLDRMDQSPQAISAPKQAEQGARLHTFPPQRAHNRYGDRFGGVRLAHRGRTPP